MVEKSYSSAVAVERAVDVLFLIADRREMSLADLARAIGSSGSAVHRILTALMNKGLVEQPIENGTYTLSWSILALTRRLSAAADLKTVSLPLMRTLSGLAEETVTLNVRSGFDRVCIDAVEGPHEIRWQPDIGRISPLYAGATGKVLLAYMTPHERDRFFQEVSLEKLTPSTIVNRKALDKELAEVRRSGIAFGSQDRVLGVSGVSAPIIDSQGAAVAAITIAGPAERCTRKRCENWIEPLTAATREIATILSPSELDHDKINGREGDAEADAAEALIQRGSTGRLA